MINYLAIDFGTSNCVAGVLERTSEGMKLRLIPLEKDVTMLPSVLFVQQKDLPPLHISDTAFQIRLTSEELREQQRLLDLEKEICEMLSVYERQHGPRVKKPKLGDYLSAQSYNKAMERYQKDSESLPLAQKRFRETELAEYESEIRAQLIRVLDKEQLKRKVKFSMARSLTEARSRLLWDKTFFGALLSDDMRVFYGNSAINEYSTDPMSGFLMRSPKAFLASEIQEQHREIFIRAISRIFRRIRESAEGATAQTYNGVVVGRPVNFMGNDEHSGNSRAVSIIREAAQRAGFVEVRFVLEPLAASLAIRRKLLDTDDPVLVIDIGGGTTDVAYLDVNPEKDESFSVRNVAGARIGGNDFDEAIAWSQISPFLGRGALFKDGKAIPSLIISAALKTRDIHQQARFRRSGDEIENFLQYVCDRDVENVTRLYEMFLNQLQHQVLMTAERIKKRVNSNALVTEDLRFFETPFVVELDYSQFVTSCESSLRRICSIVEQSLRDSGQPLDPVRVFLTGGMSQNSVVVDAIKAILPKGSSIDYMPAFKSIVGGLSIVAHTLNSSSSLLLEPDLVRGVAVMR